MPSVNVQFHMLPDEIIDFVAGAVSRYGLGAELERFHPTERCEVPVGGDLAGAAAGFGRFDVVWLLYRPPRCRKYERFMLHVGGLRGMRLAQAHFGAGTDKASAMPVLRQIAQDLKRETMPGVWVIGATGNVGYQKDFRVSSRAASMARSGQIELCSVAFTQQFKVDPLEEP